MMTQNVSLIPFGKKGYVWQRIKSQYVQKQGRVLIILDDYFELPLWIKNELPPSGHAFGLRELFEYAQQAEDVQAIGFFELPDSKEVEISQAIMTEIKEWFDSLDLVDYECYLLVDYFLGTGISKDTAFGFYFVKHWMENPIIQANIAHLTIGGVPKSLGNPYKLKIFNRTRIQEKQRLTEDLLAWLGDKKHPLDSLWHDEASTWFTDDRPVMKHDVANIYPYFFGQSQDEQKALRYQENVEGALGLALPSDWWQSQASLKHLHNSLKSLCGAYSCCHVKQSNGKRNISIGAAFLIAMMAHYEIYKHINLFATPEILFACEQSDSPLFPVQSKEIAQASAKALYDFFHQIFMPRNESLSTFQEQERSLVKRVFFDSDGKKLKIQLDWKEEQRKNLSEKIKEIFDQNSVPIPTSPGNTRDAIVRLWSYMTISETGFMSPGVIYMEGDEVILASTK